MARNNWPWAGRLSVCLAACLVMCRSRCMSLKGAGPLLRRMPDGFDEAVNFGNCDIAKEMSLRAEAVDAEALAHLASGEYGGLTCLMNIVGPKLAAQMHMEAKILGETLKPSKYWSSWQEGRGDAYRLINKPNCELMGYCGLACGIELLEVVCARLGLQPTSELQLARFGPGDAYEAHTDSSALEDLDEAMPLEQRRMIASRRITAILYLNNDWDASFEGALRANGRVPVDVPRREVCHECLEHGRDNVLPYGGSLVLFRSRDLEHEVLPPKKNRYAMTMWYVEKGVVRSFEVRLDTEMLGLSLCGLAACEHEKSGCTAQKAIVIKVAEQSLFDQKTSHRMNDGSCQQRSLEAVTHI
ncbi:unnamed protein product [Effrenium voratum]|nr:unnamed protein product [Effrenium voratum]